MKANKENRIGIVTFSGNSDVFLPLDSYTTTNINNQYDYLNYDEGGWVSNPSISTSNTIRNSDSQRVSKNVDVNGGTYTQSGMATGSNLLINNNDTKDRVPIMILLSGLPTTKLVPVFEHLQSNYICQMKYAKCLMRLFPGNSWLSAHAKF